MKYIARTILWIVDHEIEICFVAFPFLLVALIYAMKYALECAMW